VFWGGGCDTREVLPHGTPAEVRDHVRRQVDIMARDGGFVFQQCTTSWRTCRLPTSWPCSTR
jgi:hypothetical protein